MDYVISLGEDERQRFIKTVTELLQPSKEGKIYKTLAEVEAEINQLVSQSVVTEDVIDIYQTLGLKQPDLSILSDDFLKDVEGLKQKLWR